MDLKVSIRRSSGKHKVRTPSNLCWHACMQRTASRAFRDAPTYLVCAPLRSTSLSGCGRGVRLQLQTKRLPAACVHPPQPLPRPMRPCATADRLCALRLRYRRGIALSRRRGRGQRRSAGFGARAAEGARLGRAAGHREPRAREARRSQPCAVRVRSHERCGPQMPVWSRPKGTGAGSRAVCRPGSDIMALVVHVSVPWLVMLRYARS